MRGGHHTEMMTGETVTEIGRETETAGVITKGGDQDREVRQDGKMSGIETAGPTTLAEDDRDLGLRSDILRTRGGECTDVRGLLGLASRW